MLDTYIKNRGKTKTLMYNNDHSNVNELKWDADYDGKVANISLDLVNDGKRGHYDVKLSNKDIEDILNIPSVNMPLERRLENDYRRNNFKRYHFIPETQMREIPMREIELQTLNREYPIKTKKHTKIELSIEELIKMAQNKDNDLSSPSNKEFILSLIHISEPTRPY